MLVSYLPTKNELYGEADAELLGDNQRILGATTRSMIDLLPQRQWPDGCPEGI